MSTTVAELESITQAIWRLLDVRLLFVCMIAPGHLYDVIRFFKIFSLVREKLQEKQKQKQMNKQKANQELGASAYLSTLCRFLRLLAVSGT